MRHTCGVDPEEVLILGKDNAALGIAIMSRVSRQGLVESRGLVGVQRSQRVMSARGDGGIHRRV
jgi:hypothetical protein